jgi:transcriptional regulator CtsR
MSDLIPEELFDGYAVFKRAEQTCPSLQAHQVTHVLDAVVALIKERTASETQTQAPQGLTDEEIMSLAEQSMYVRGFYDESGSTPQEIYHFARALLEAHEAKRSQP